jgi:hypothetical protein
MAEYVHCEWARERIAQDPRNMLLVVHVNAPSGESASMYAGSIELAHELLAMLGEELDGVDHWRITDNLTGEILYHKDTIGDGFFEYVAELPVWHQF